MSKQASSRVLVFCASSASCDLKFHEAAARLGRVLARRGCELVYGGGAVGSMGALADAALAEGGRVVGIQPRFMNELEWAHDGLTALHLVDDMQERKRRMLASSDAVVALPGGSGTFEELLEAVTAKRLGLYTGPLVILNQEGFYDPLLALFERAIAERMMDERHRDIWSVVDEPEQVPDAIESAPPWSEDALRFAAL